MSHGLFFCNDTATTEIYTLSLTTLFRSLPRPPRALPLPELRQPAPAPGGRRARRGAPRHPRGGLHRSEEHTSELQSRQYLVCRLLLEKKSLGSTMTASTTTVAIYHPQRP